MRNKRQQHSPSRARGFTLIELLVAIAVLAMLAVMSWRGIDGMARAQAQLHERADAVLTLQSALGQWSSDLDATIALAPSRPIDWNGKALRLTRRSSAGSSTSVLVVAWTLRADTNGVLRWHRWQSPPLSTRGDWQQAWNQAATWAQDGDSSAQGGSDVALLPAQSWQLLYFRNDIWSPAVGAETLPAAESFPNGVRLVLVLPPGPALAGTLTLDWVKPSASIAKS